MCKMQTVLKNTLPKKGFEKQDETLWVRKVDGMKVFNQGPFTNIYKDEELQEVFDEGAFRAPKRQFIKRLESML